MHQVDVRRGGGGLGGGGGMGRGRFGHGDVAVADEQTEQVWKAPPRWLPATLHSLAYRDFTLLWLAQITNSLSLWMEQVARPILVLLVTGSGVHLGLVVAARGAPQLFLAPVAGVVADRFDRRMVILASKALGMVVNMVFAAIILTGNLELWHIYVTSLLRSLLNAFDNPARQALLPNLVPPRLLVNAIGLNSGSMQLVRVVAASVAGFTIALFGIGGTFLIIGLISIVPVALTYMMRMPEAERAGRRRDQESFGRSIIGGFRFAWQEKAVLAILLLLAFQSLFGNPYLQVFVPLLALQYMNFGFLELFGIAGEKAHEVGLGLLLAASGGGALIGSIVVATVGDRVRYRGMFVLVGLGLYGAAIASMALSALTPLIVLPFLFVSLVGIGQSLLLAMKNAILMDITPNELRGRIFSLQSLDRGLGTLGASGGGFLAAAIGAPLGMAAYGVIVVLSVIWVGLFLPALRRVD